MEKKYFISYVAYAQNNETKLQNGKDFFNETITIDENISSELLMDIEEGLMTRLNDNIETSTYYAVQIMFFKEI